MGDAVMSGRIRKWLVLLVCASLVASGLSAYAETLTLVLDSEKSKGAEFEIFKIGVPEGSPTSAWGPTGGFKEEGLTFPGGSGKHPQGF